MTEGLLLLAFADRVALLAGGTPLDDLDTTLAPVGLTGVVFAPCGLTLTSFEVGAEISPAVVLLFDFAAMLLGFCLDTAVLRIEGLGEAAFVRAALVLADGFAVGLVMVLIGFLVTAFNVGFLATAEAGFLATAFGAGFLATGLWVDLLEVGFLADAGEVLGLGGFLARVLPAGLDLLRVVVLGFVFWLTALEAVIPLAEPDCFGLLG